VREILFSPRAKFSVRRIYERRLREMFYEISLQHVVLSFSNERSHRVLRDIGIRNHLRDVGRHDDGLTKVYVHHSILSYFFNLSPEVRWSRGLS
jgi:hypothetical protein